MAMLRVSFLRRLGCNVRLGEADELGVVGYLAAISIRDFCEVSRGKERLDRGVD